jgi:hypothetical protein
LTLQWTSPYSMLLLFGSSYCLTCLLLPKESLSHLYRQGGPLTLAETWVGWLHAMAMCSPCERANNHTLPQLSCESPWPLVAGSDVPWNRLLVRWDMKPHH